jgi:hypothetical protein
MSLVLGENWSDFVIFENIIIKKLIIINFIYFFSGAAVGELPA